MKVLRVIAKCILVIIPFLLFSFFLFLIISLGVLQQRVESEKVLPPLATLSQTISYPVLTLTSVPLSAEGAIVFDADTKVIVFSKNPSVRFSPASTTKIMSATIGLQYFKPSDVLTVTGPLDPEGSGLGLVEGQKITFENILFGMMLPSANDAAQTLAENYPGGVDAFVTKMNEQAKSLQLYNTHFADPAGLDDDGNYTTVMDLARLAAFARENTLLKNIVRQKSAIIATADGKTVFALHNLNILLGQYGINGMKTGRTDGAGEVLVTSVTHENHNYIVVVMKSEDRFDDTLQLVTKVIPNVKYVTLTY
jgi:serine-type D-Ala-D-Ala carboxypeptidase (penicillin-binding protein 5/6)